MRGLGIGLAGTVMALGLAGCPTGANEPQAPQVRYEHSEVLAEGTMENGTPASIGQSAYGDANTLSVKEEMNIGGEVVGSMGWKTVQRNGVCQLVEVSLYEVNMFGTYLPGNTTFTDNRCDGTLDTLDLDGAVLTRGVEFLGVEDGMDDVYQAVEQTVSDNLSVPQRMSEWDAARRGQ